MTCHVELAHWYGEEANLARNDEAVFRKALDEARQAQKLDRDSKDGFLAEYRLLKGRAEAGGKLGRDAIGRAARVFQAVVERDPTEAALHFELAQLYFEADEPALGRLEADRALELDRQASAAARRLSQAQREELERRRQQAR